MLTAALSTVTPMDALLRHRYRVRLACRLPTAIEARMKNSAIASLWICLAVTPLMAQGQASSPGGVDNHSAPQMRFETEDFIKLKPGENLGEVLGVAVNSKGEVAV